MEVKLPSPKTGKGGVKSERTVGGQLEVPAIAVPTDWKVALALLPRV